jgi:hypothetical protein
MISSYNTTWLRNLAILKEAKTWVKSNIISADQFQSIAHEYPSAFYHPNIIIRILLFIATWIAIGGIAGLFVLVVGGASEATISILCIVYGLASLSILEKLLIQNGRHYKSGVTEAILYQALGFIIGGIGGLTDFNEHVMLLSCIIICLIAAIRYHDLLLTASAFVSLGAFVFYELYQAGDLTQQIIPLIMLVVFTPLYFFISQLKSNKETELWHHCLVTAEVLTLCALCLAGNYMVVRELSIELINADLAPEEEIPLAFLFYALTVFIPLTYLYFGIRRKNIVLLRVTILALTFAVFTFKHYFLPENNEIFLTVSGALLLVISIALFRHLKEPKNGFTRNQLIMDKLANLNAEAFIISQTMGGNEVTAEPKPHGGGGTFGGGGASGEF